MKDPFSHLADFIKDTLHLENSDKKPVSFNEHATISSSWCTSDLKSDNFLFRVTEMQALSTVEHVK